jgi:WD40 repeat protein
LIFSPCSNYLATSSEDQTTKIWSLEGELLKILKNHTSAVTSIDWQKTSMGDYLLTCGDDCKIYQYNPENWEMENEYCSNKLIESWHTLTYLSIEKNGSRVVLSTQNGYIVIFCLRDKKCVYNKKLHTGSIEGLIWKYKRNLISSVSSDCTVNLYKI